MKKLSVFLLSLSALAISFASTPTAEAGHCRTRVSVRAPVVRVTAPRVVVTAPRVHVPAPVVVVRPPHRSYHQVYVASYGAPHQVWVDGWYDQYGRWHAGYWTWTY